MTATPEGEVRWFMDCWQRPELASREEIASHFRSVFEPTAVVEFLQNLREGAPNPTLAALDASEHEALALLDVGGEPAELWLALSTEGISGFSVRGHDASTERIPFAELECEPSIAVSGGDGSHAGAVADDVARVVSEARAEGVVGLAARLVLRDGSSVSVDHGFGDGFARIPLDGSTVFRIGSVSKVVTAVAVLQRFDPDELVRPLSRSIEVDSDVVTFRHLLTHTAGVPRLAGDRVSFERTPGGEPEYSNDGYEVLGSVLADATGQPYLEVAADVVASGTGGAPSAGHRVAFGSVERAHWQDEEGGAGGVSSTADGLTALATLVAGPEGEVMRRVVFPDRSQLGYNGALSGFRAAWWVDVDSGASCSVLSNTDGAAAPPPWTVRDRLFEAMARNVD